MGNFCGKCPEYFAEGTSESLLRCGEILWAERSQLLPHTFLGSAIPPGGNIIKIPRARQFLAFRNTHSELLLGAGGTHVRAFRCICSEFMQLPNCYQFWLEI